MREHLVTSRPSDSKHPEMAMNWSKHVTRYPQEVRDIGARLIGKRSLVSLDPRLRLHTNLCSTLQQQPRSGNTVSPELLARLPSALKETNRGMLAQNMMWVALQPTEQRRKQFVGNLFTSRLRLELISITEGVSTAYNM